MNKDQAEGKLSQLSGKIKEVWGRLSDDDIALLNGKRDQFMGRLQTVYGLKKEEAEKRFSEIEKASTRSSSKAA